jgi:hypothetical protein
MVRVLFCTKIENDIITKKLKEQGRNLCSQQFVQIDATKEKLMTNWDNAQAWDKLINRAQELLEKAKMD